MRTLRRSGTVLGALSLLVLSSCVDSGVVAPNVDQSGPSMAIWDGSTFGSDDFYFLPPLADGNPNPVGTFNPNLLPSLRICELDGDPGLDASNLPISDCVTGAPFHSVAPGAATAGSNQYQYSFDTDGPGVGNWKRNEFYRMEVLVGATVMGWIDLDPQNPQGPGQSTADAYAFRVGETIPVKFFLSTDVLCVPSVFVTECITGAVVNQTGADLSLTGAGNKLGVTIASNTLPLGPDGSVVVTIERIDPDAFRIAMNGEECIPGLGGIGGFDAPQFGDCFRITTDPVVTLTGPALVSICIDPTSLPINLTEEQENQLTMVRFNDVTNVWEGLPDTAGDCPIQTASLLRVPETGFMRYAAMGVNALADLVAPEPLSARDLNLGGLTSSFSRFRYALPGQMIPTAGDGAVIGASDDNTITATVQVVDHEGVAVENAVVHFSTDDGTIDGATATTADVVSDASGNATVQWTVDRSITPSLTKTLTANALGLFDTTVPEHDMAYPFTARSVAVTAEIVGPPSALGQNPDGPITGAVAGEPQTLSVTVTDANTNTVAGAEVMWTCTGTCIIPPTSTTDANGVATVQWTPQSAGSQASAASINGLNANFTASVAPAAAVEPTYPTPPATGTAGVVLPDPLVITVVDAFGNAREGDVVSWTVGTNSGAVSQATSTVGSDGTTQVTWTLDQMAGANTLTVSVGGFSSVLTVTGEPGPAVQPAGTGGGQSGVVGQGLTDVLSVTLADQFGNPIAGEAFTFSGAGSFAPASGTTDAAGVAQTTWTLGTTAGAQTATVSVGGFTVNFGATAAPGDAATLSATQTATTAPIGGPVGLGITVKDSFGNIRAGDAVTWSIVSGGGSFTSTTTPTGADGTATASWTLGSTPGANSATVSVGTVSHTFNANGICLAGWGTSDVNGSFGATEWVCANSEAFTANLSGGSTDAVVYWMNDATNLYMAVRVRRSALDNTNSLRIDFNNDGTGPAVAGDDAIGFDGKAMKFLDEHLTARCANNNQSGCGNADTVKNGAGMVTNDGTWTTYELSHPLTGDANNQDFTRTGGQLLSFFLTLRQGNGAQGNTQYPGFRNYRDFIIVPVPGT